MRRSLILASCFILAGCATRPQLPETPAVQSPTTREPRGILGMSTTELDGHFGNPALQIREGTSLKLQFRGRSCVLDAYLYPQSGGTLRVTHVDTRSPNGADMDQAACIFALENPS